MKVGTENGKLPASALGHLNVHVDEARATQNTQQRVQFNE